MKKFNNTLVSMLLIITLIVSAIVPVSAAGTQPSKYSTTNNSGERHVVCTTLSGTSASSYYTGSYQYENLEDLSASTLLTTLRGLMTATHKTQTSYANCRDYANRTDCENGNGTDIITIYTSYASSHSEYNSGSGWNREHVWPKSLGGFDTAGAGADLHHIRPSENRTNSNRGNKLYGNVSGGTKSTGNLSGLVGGYYAGNYYEPLDEVKGDVARICLYVYVRYGAEYSQCSKITNVFQSVDVLLEWCELDPVDTWEMGRNEVVGAIQGNRNVFIDYPELAWLIFGKEIPSGMQTPSGIAMGKTPDDDGKDDPTCTHSTTEIKNKTEATCTAAGYTGDTYCKSCGTKLSTGTAIAAKDHTWSEWQTNEADGVKTRTCLTCAETESTALPTCKHSMITTTAPVAPTCDEDGRTSEQICFVCKTVIVAGEVIPKTGNHEWSEMVVTVQPTASSAGEGTYTCNGCGMIKTVKLNPVSEEEMIADRFSWCVVYAILGEYLSKA